MLEGEGWGEGIIREFRVDMHTLLYLKWVTKPTVQHMELCSILCGSLDEGSVGESGYTHMDG